MQKPKGTYDLYGSEINYWLYLEDSIRSICKLFNFSEIRTPIFESYDTFHRNLNDSSDMVNKETYDFLDRSNRKLTLRPEGTAGVCRSFVENKLYVDGFQKYYYLGPMFRYERSQKGRYRQFAQFGLEAFGCDKPYLDAEVIICGYTLLNNLGLKNFSLRVNTLGLEEERKSYLNAMKDYFSKYYDNLCPDCKNRFESNPLRILDCKVCNTYDFFKNAPKIYDYLKDETKDHFKRVLDILDYENIKYTIDYNLVRGLDYYCHTVFEYDFNSSTFSSTLGGGGRYNNLVSEFNGPHTPSCGLAFGMERLVIAMKEDNINLCSNLCHFYIIVLSDSSFNYAYNICLKLRKLGFSSDISFNLGSLKKQFKDADRKSPLYTLIIGEDEVSKGIVQLKDNTNKKELTLSLLDLYTFVGGLNV